MTPADFQGQDYGNLPRALYHTVLTLLVMAGVVYVTIWCWSRNPGFQQERYPGASAKHWSGVVWVFGLIMVWLIAWAIW